MKIKETSLLCVLFSILILFTGTAVTHEYHIVGVDSGTSAYQSIYTVTYIEEIFIFKITRYAYFNSKINMEKWIDMMGMGGE